MADEDKVINVAIKYTTPGADDAAKVSSNVKEANKAVAQDAKVAAEAIEKSNTAISKSAIESLQAMQKQKVSVAALIKEYEALEVEAEKYNKLLEYNKDSPVYNEAMGGIKSRMAEIEAEAQRRVDAAAPKTPVNAGLPIVQDQAGQVDKVRSNFERLNKETEKYYHNLKQAGVELTQVGNILSVGGGLLTAGAMANAQNYVTYMGKTTELSSKWLAAQERIKKANLEIGESTASVILPAVQAGAELMERVAEIAESHPWLVQGVLGAGGIMLALGAATKVIGEITKVVADLGLMLGKAGLMQTMNSLGGVGAGEYMPGGSAASKIFGKTASEFGVSGTVAIAAMSVAAIYLGSEALGNWLGKQMYGDKWENQNVGDAMVTLTKIFQLPWLGLASILDKMGPSMQGVVQWILETANAAQKLVGDVTGASQYKRKAEDEDTSQQMTQAFIDYQEAVSEAQSNYSEQRKQIIADSESEIVNVTKQYNDQRASVIASAEKQIAGMISSYQQSANKAASSYKENEKKATDSYNDSVAKAQRDFEINQRRAAQAHQREMARLAEQHDDRMQALAASRDALGLVKEQRSYQREKSQKEQDYQTQRQQAQEDQQLRLADMRQAFIKQRAEAKQAYEQQRAEALQALQQRVADARASEAERLAQLAAQHKADLLRIEQQEEEKLAKLDESYKKQVDQMQTSFIDRLRALDPTILGDAAAFEKYMQSQALAFRQWLENFKAQASAGSKTTAGVIGSHAAGGYAVFQGNGEDGREEFVMGSDLTRAAENALGGRLSQAGALSAIMAGRMMSSGAGGKSLQITVQGRSLTTQEIRNEISNALDMKLADLLPAFGAY